MVVPSCYKTRFDLETSSGRVLPMCVTIFRAPFTTVFPLGDLFRVVPFKESSERQNRPILGVGLPLKCISNATYYPILLFPF